MKVDEIGGRVGYMGEIANAYKIVVGSMAEKEALLKTLMPAAGGGGGLKVKLILKNLEEGRGMDYFCSGETSVVEICKHGNNLSNFTKYGEFPEHLNLY